VSEAITKQKHCTYLNNAIRKYGKESFKCELLFECELDELDEYKQMCIEEYKSLYPTGYNLTNGGKGAFYVSKVYNNNTIVKNDEPYKHSNTTKAKIKQKLKDILSSDEKHQERSEKCRIQHMKARLDKYKNILIDDNNKYILYANDVDFLNKLREQNNNV
jgi:hypothetical protein